MLTASVVLFNTPQNQILRVIQSVLASGAVETLYVIDNSPHDGRRILEQESPCVRYIHSANNGYGSGHNIALREAMERGADYHVVLNPDIQFGAEVLPALVRFMDAHPDAGCAMPKVTYPDGALQYLCKLLPSPLDLMFRRFLPAKGMHSRRNARYELRDSGYDAVMNPPSLSGCFMFLNLTLLKKHGLLFDEGYFMYCEDLDLVRRIHRVAGTLYYPGVHIVHDHARASYSDRRMLRTHIRSAIRYFNKFGWIFDPERRSMNRQILDEIERKSE